MTTGAVLLHQTIRDLTAENARLRAALETIVSLATIYTMHDAKIAQEALDA